MKFSKVLSILCVSGSLLSLGAIAVISGCATPVEIGPTVQPGNIMTPRITPVFPPTNDIRELPAGFVPCGQYTAPIKLDDGTVVNITVCIYCSNNPNDPTVYVQQNCEGPYKKGIRNSRPGDRNEAPKSKRLSNLGGDIGITYSEVTFTVDEGFSIDPVMLKGNTASLKISDPEGDFVVRDGDDVNLRGITDFPAGTKVSISGDNANVADILYWTFGVGQLSAVTTLNDFVELFVVHDDEVGMVVVGRVNGVQDPDLMGFLPWRR